MKPVLVTCLSFMLIACGAGNGTGGNNQQTDGELTGLEKIQNEIFSPICAECHIGSGAPQGLQLDSLENSFNFLVGIESSEIPERLRVAPGDPDSSYLVQKIEGASGIVGGQMPLGGSALSNQQITLIRNWILDGAEQSDVQKVDQYTQGKLTSNSRLSTGSASTTEVEMVGIYRTDDVFGFDFYFTHPIDPDSLSISAPLLFLSDEDSRILVPLDDYEVSLSGRQINILYRGYHQSGMQLILILNYSGLAELRDVNGLRIDGDDDGLEGGEFSYVYIF